MKRITSTETFLKVKNYSLAIICCCIHWTAPCVSQEKILKQLFSADIKKIPIYYLDLSLLPDLTWKLRVKTVPTILIFKHGMEKQRVTGVQSLKWFQSLLANIA